MGDGFDGVEDMRVYLTSHTNYIAFTLLLRTTVPHLVHTVDCKSHCQSCTAFALQQFPQ
jgi:hypothetical protein